MAEQAPRIELLWWPGCPSWEQALSELRRQVQAAGLDPAQIEVRAVESESDAEREGFAGSPTIRIDGSDVQAPADDRSPALACRVYRLRDGRVSPTPDPADVREAIERAKGAEQWQKSAQRASR
jgi:hypothetical protein